MGDESQLPPDLRMHAWRIGVWKKHVEPGIERNTKELNARYIVRKRKQSQKDLERCNRKRKPISYEGLNAFIKQPNPPKLGIRWKGPIK